MTKTHPPKADSTKACKDSPKKIGIFDSGVGGLSLVKEFVDHKTYAEIFYLADTKYFPYGNLDPDKVMRRAQSITKHFGELGIKDIAIACNTATTIAISALRKMYAGMRFFGIEPGIKPAEAISQNGSIVVLATQNTLKSKKYKALKKRMESTTRIQDLPMNGLASAIEKHPHDIRRILDPYLHTISESAKSSSSDTVVLACTHYHLIKTELESRLKNVQILSPIDGLYRHMQKSLDLKTAKSPRIHISTTSNSSNVTNWGKNLFNIKEVQIQDL